MAFSLAGNADAQKPPAKPHYVVAKPAQVKKPAPAPAPQPAQAAPPAQNGPEPDLAFGAFQRGYYITAFGLATQRAADNNDAKAMTLLGELYANGLGVPQDDQKAASWYRLAAARGDANAMFALAMFDLQGRAGPRNRQESAKWLAAAAKLGHSIAAYDLALLYIEGELFPRDFPRAAELLRQAADAGNPQAQYALGTLYKDGRGVPRDMKQAVHLFALAALGDETDAEVEYGIALFNGDGVERNQPLAAALFRKAALKGNPIAQDRLALILAHGVGAKADPVEAAKWHLIAKAAGDTDIDLDVFVGQLDATARATAEQRAQPWIALIKQAIAANTAASLPVATSLTATSAAAPSLAYGTWTRQKSASLVLDGPTISTLSGPKMLHLTIEQLIIDKSQCNLVVAATGEGNQIASQRKCSISGDAITLDQPRITFHYAVNDRTITLTLGDKSDSYVKTK